MARFGPGLDAKAIICFVFLFLGRVPVGLNKFETCVRRPNVAPQKKARENERMKRCRYHGESVSIISRFKGISAWNVRMLSIEEHCSRVMRGYHGF